MAPGRRWPPQLGLLLVIVALPCAAGEPLVGQLVCSECWSEADRTQVAYGTPADLACAARCAAKGVPPALAVRGGEGFELLEIEGQPPGGGTWLERIARFARVEGEVRRVGDGRVLRASRLELLDESPWPAPGAGEPGGEPHAIGARWTDLRGRDVALDDFRGRIVVLNFWATWCKPCVEEMPDLARIQRAYGVHGVQVVGAAADGPQDAERVLKFARRVGIEFPVLLGADTSQMHALGLGEALPATAVLDENGQVVERIRGVVDPDELKKVLDGLLHDGPQGDPDLRAAVEPHHHHRHASGSHASLVPS